MIMNGKTPTLISGVPKRTPSRAMIRSQASARPSAPASTWPFAAHSVGLPSSPISRNRRGKRASVSKCLWTSGTSAAKPARLPPSEKTVSCVEVSTTQRTAVVVARRREGREQLVEQLVGERVARLGLVEGDRGDAGLDRVAERLVGHAGAGA